MFENPKPIKQIKSDKLKKKNKTGQGIRARLSNEGIQYLRLTVSYKNIIFSTEWRFGGKNLTHFECDGMATILSFDNPCTLHQPVRNKTIFSFRTKTKP